MAALLSNRSHQTLDRDFMKDGIAWAGGGWAGATASPTGSRSCYGPGPGGRPGWRRLGSPGGTGASTGRSLWPPLDDCGLQIPVLRGYGIVLSRYAIAPLSLPSSAPASNPAPRQHLHVPHLVDVFPAAGRFCQIRPAMQREPPSARGQMRHI